MIGHKNQKDKIITLAVEKKKKVVTIWQRLAENTFPADVKINALGNCFGTGEENKHMAMKKCI